MKGWKEKLSARKFRRCPDFELATLETSSQDLFRKGVPLDRFVLALCLFFNDLKGIHWWVLQLNKGAPPKNYPRDCYAGEFGGMSEQILRIATGMATELLRLIRKSADIVDSPEFREVLDRMDPHHREVWDAVVDAASGEPISLKSRRHFFGFLEQLRADTAFHYDNPKALMRGYERHFRSGKSSYPGDRPAYSLGETMEQSRFYFADAAVQEYRLDAFEEFGKETQTIPTPKNTVQHLMWLANNSIRYIGEAFIEMRNDKIDS